MAENTATAKPDAPEKREAKPFRVRRTGSDKTIFETTDEAAARKYVADNFPRAHHEADDHDVYLQAPNGSKQCFNSGAADDGWSDYKTPREREDD